MKLGEALKVLQAANAAEAHPYTAGLVCGFTPLHLETFLAAHLQQRLPGRKIAVQTGLFGDTPGTLQGLVSDAHVASVAIALEWQDLDPRLGFRAAGAWGPSALPDIAGTAGSTLRRMSAAIQHIAEMRAGSIPIACSLPTIPLPPVFHPPGWQASAAELDLERQLLEFAAACSACKGFSLVNRNRLAEESPAPQRFDLKSDLLTGLPYSVAHADRVAAALARLIAPPAPKKGLITDLDDTLWQGIVGEIGPENVSWDLAGHAQLHGLYQKTLAMLSEEGVLVGIASKNDPEIARCALERADILLPPARVFPVEVHWNAKSGSVARILRAWNIAADSVVFVDDSPMELAEVAAAHPGIECVPFPSGDVAAGMTLLNRLRDLFGKPRLGAEDAIRLESLRQGAAFQQAAQDGASPDDFLRHAEAIVTFDFDAQAPGPRVLELVNKTNQFNLNGVRYTEAEWRSLLAAPGAILMAVDYRDKFGPLGKIAVIQGHRQNETLHIGSWVMSCRAFARRIEHQCLKMLFERSGAGCVVLDFAPTAKNSPLRDFLASLTGAAPEGPVTVTNTQFAETCPPLYHRTEEAESSRQLWTQSQPA